MDNIDNMIAELMASEKFWQYISEELEKRTGESRLGGKYATDLAKKMFASLSKNESQSLIDCVTRHLGNQQNAGSQWCK